VRARRVRSGRSPVTPETAWSVGMWISCA
jgi:hypothetical protein